MCLSVCCLFLIPLSFDKCFYLLLEYFISFLNRGELTCDKVKNEKDFKKAYVQRTGLTVCCNF